MKNIILALLACAAFAGAIEISPRIFSSEPQLGEYVLTNKDSKSIYIDSIRVTLVDTGLSGVWSVGISLSQGSDDGLFEYLAKGTNEGIAKITDRQFFKNKVPASDSATLTFTMNDGSVNSYNLVLDSITKRPLNLKNSIKVRDTLNLDLKFYWHDSGSTVAQMYPYQVQSVYIPGSTRVSIQPYQMLNATVVPVSGGWSVPAGQWSLFTPDGRSIAVTVEASGNRQTLRPQANSVGAAILYEPKLGQFSVVVP